MAVEGYEDILYVFLRGDNGFDPASLEATMRIGSCYRRANLEDVFLRLTG